MFLFFFVLYRLSSTCVYLLYDLVKPYSYCMYMYKICISNIMLDTKSCNTQTNLFSLNNAKFVKSK